MSVCVCVCSHLRDIPFVQLSLVFANIFQVSGLGMDASKINKHVYTYKMKMFTWLQSLGNTVVKSTEAPGKSVYYLHVKLVDSVVQMICSIASVFGHVRMFY